MAQTTNMEILSFLLQAPALNTWTQGETDQINNLPPLNNYTTGTPPRRFLYDPTKSVIRYAKSVIRYAKPVIRYAKSENPLFGAQEYQDLLSQKPYFTFIGIEVYLAS